MPAALRPEVAGASATADKIACLTTTICGHGKVQAIA
jgi:hypothetical protein